MQALTYKIRLLEPVLATQAQSDEPNSAVTYPFIPGSMIRGALISTFLKVNKLTRLDMESQDIRDLFFTGKTQYLNAYLAYPDLQMTRALPRPISWLVEKDDADLPDASIYDFAIETQEWDKPAKPPEKGEFCWAKNGVAYLGNPQLQVTIHNASDDPDYKVEGSSQVYRYDALAARQILAGVILMENDSALDTVKALLEKGIFNLGGSLTAGYGSVEIFDVTETKHWQEYQEDAFVSDTDDNPPEETLVTLTCLSDVILRDETGQVDMGFATVLDCSPIEIFRKIRVVGGFNRTWGLPLDQAIAIQAGSVFVFPKDCYNKLRTFIAAGIGERRAEGFGRIAVNWHHRPKIEQSEFIPSQITDAAPEELSENSKKLAKVMAKRQLQTIVDMELIRQINRHSAEFSNLPSATQLSRARLAAQRAWHKNDLSELSGHFKRLTKFTRREWEEMRTKNGKFLLWMENLLKEPKNFSPDIGDIPIVGGESARFSDLRTDTIARLIEGILRRAERKAKEIAGGEQHG